MNRGNVLLLNKPFLGGWLNRQGNIGHEIIDFLVTDDGSYYVYNNPWGVCPDNIWIDGTLEFPRNSKEKYLGKYMILTSEERGKDFDILYVIELCEKLHRYHTVKKEDNKQKFRADQSKIRQLIRRRNIKYNGKFLDEIYTEDDSLLLTFKGKKIYKAENPITVQGLSYNFQRNKGYIYDDEYPDDYALLLRTIEEAMSNGRLTEFSPRSVSPETIGHLDANKTFLDLIALEDNEQVFTNILHSVLGYSDILKCFCQEFKEGKDFDDAADYKVFRETKVVDGRMDVCAESSSQRVIIENKVYSGLNGIRPADNTTQLSTYYRWGIDKEMPPLCFIIAPNFRVGEVQREIRQLDPDMADIYLIKTYGDIASFIERKYQNGDIGEDYVFYSLIEQIINAFRNLSYTTKEDLYARMFLSATA